MTTNESFSEKAMLEGLLNNDPAALDQLFAAYKKPVAGIITAMGGSSADGSVFFKTALIDLAVQLRAGQEPLAETLQETLESLAKAQYLAWLAERQQPVPDTPPAPGNLPSESALQATRRKIFCWKQLEIVPKNGREVVRLALGEQLDDQAIATATGKTQKQFAGSKAEWIAEFRRNIRILPSDSLPEWVIEALTDTEGWQRWQAIQLADLRQDNAVPSGPNQRNKLVRNIFMLFLGLIILWGIWLFFHQPKPASEVFKQNFEPPQSILEDLDARYGAARGNDSVTARPNACEMQFQLADEYFKRRDYEQAATNLVPILEDSFSVCQSDAWYYLGIINLQEGDPAASLECFAKIDNLEAFGEDIYWYQALSFVKLAAIRPLMREKAARAVERFLAQTRNEDRRRMAAKMLEDLRK